jgi:hypothetical protein
MSSEHLASAQNQLKGDLAGSWNILDGASGQYTDLGIARRFGGSAAAYSLRDIGAMNGRVVKVRRSEDDLEVDFSASQVASGSLEDWVNGKQENTLPADVATAAAAYSLRKVKASYADDAVRIRRSSDGVEVDVAFDSDDKVSLSSAVTNVAEQGGESGSTTATTLGSFLSETAPNFSENALNFDGSSTYVQVTQFVLSGDFTVSFDAFVDFNNGGGGRVAGRSSAAGWIGNIASSTSLTFRANGQSGKTITFDSAISSGEHSFVLTRSSNTVSLSIDGVTQSDTESETNDFTINFIGRQAGNYFKGSLRNINFGSASYNGYGSTDADWEDQTGSNDGTVNGTADTFIGDSAFVHTWYDQAGSNDATQTTAANQPVIAENGTLLTNSMGTPTLKFVGGGLSGSSYTSGDNLDANGLASSFTGEDKAISSFVVTSAFANDKNGVIYGFGDSSDDSAKVTSLFHSDGGMGIQLRDDADNAITDQTNISYSSNEDLLFSFTRPNTTYDLNKNSVNLRNDIASDLGTTTLDRFSIGTLTRTSQALFLDGDITELIIYASDQVDNRFKIESNINNYYGLYNDEVNFTSVVSPGTLTSTITKSDETHSKL